MLLYTMGIAMFLMVLSIFIRKSWIYILWIPAWVGVIILAGKTGLDGSKYIQIVGGIIIIIACVLIFKSITRGDLV